MINEILAAWQSSNMATPKPAHACRHCLKAFSKPETLVSHMCEKKRRHQQEDEVGVRWGMQAFLRFYEIAQGPSKNKTYKDFSDSPYYIAFVKFGRYCVSIRCINFLSFTTWLLKTNKKLDQWCSDSLYEQWLIDYSRKESVQDALERGLKEMTEYAELNTELKNGYVDYFRFVHGNRICHHISSGRISAWIVYNCASGIEFLDSLTEDQIGIILPWIDPTHWQQRFRDNKSDVVWCKEILVAAGL